MLLCDLRGFTAWSGAQPCAQVIAMLNGYFDRVVPAITDAGGEVVKFMGDAVLAFFHHEDAAAACAAAHDAAQAALGNLAGGIGGVAVEAGIALHYGEVSYGNIGSGRRMDFTVIGRDVNLISRIQSVCADGGHPLLASPRFAGLLPDARAASIGPSQLKGFADPVELFRLPVG